MTPIRSKVLPTLSLAVGISIAAQGVSALDLVLPGGAVVVLSEQDQATRHEIATGPWQDGSVPARALSGTLTRTIWQLPASVRGVSVHALADALEEQLAGQGYAVEFSCRDRACGGFDFRNALDLGQPPEMHVDIGNFRYAAALRDDGEQGVALTVSQGGGTLYVQVARVGPGIAAPEDATRSSRAPAAGDDAPAPRTVAETLLAEGSVALDDLAFRTGASELSAADYGSLRELADFLSENPARRVVLVGHTDSRGGADGNLALSEARARAVRDYLVERLGTDAAQVDTTGIGFLAPRATNATEAGREANRRVEVVLLDEG